MVSIFGGYYSLKPANVWSHCVSILCGYLHNDDGGCGSAEHHQHDEKINNDDNNDEALSGNRKNKEPHIFR